MAWQCRRPFLVVTLVCGMLAFRAHAQIQLDSGPISGTVAGGDVRVFKGIPYAAPTSGKNRWRAPQPVQRWSEVRQCTEFGPTCPQSDVMSRRFGLTLPPMGEDCLHLNVWTPVEIGNGRLPVMVWIHGGGFVVGSAASYDGEELARQGAVVVTINYRVGVFGFLPHRLLTEESPDNASGNYGLLDIIAALQWVQRNISAFGGDPENVTVFGQSSGGTAVCYLLASPMAKGLFHRALSQSSGAYDLVPSLAEGQALGQRLFAAMGADDSASGLDAMRGKTSEELLAALAAERIRFGAIVDGQFLREQPVTTFLAGRQHNVPLLIGSNAVEADDEYTVAARFFAREQSRINPRTFRYFFTKASGDPQAGGRGPVHAAEISYVFGGRGRGAANFDESDHALAKTMSAMWLQFARTGDPNLPDQPNLWPKYDATEDTYLELGSKIAVGHRLRSAICDEVERTLNEQLKKQADR